MSIVLGNHPTRSGKDRKATKNIFIESVRQGVTKRNLADDLTL